MYGHDKGDIYLLTACRAISDVFKRSPVYRFGGDEFFVILKNEDYHNIKRLIEMFDYQVSVINSMAENPWEKVFLSKGFATYNPNEDSSVADVVQRADKLMYEDKRIRKSKQKDNTIR